MTAEEIIAALNARFEGLTPKASWGETSLFNNPGLALPNGICFCTVKDHGGANDSAALDELMPHPVYAWMGWAQILNPSRASFERLQPMLHEAHRDAVSEFVRTVHRRHRTVG